MSYEPSEQRQKIRTHILRNKYLLLILIVFGTLYSLISIVNHYNFRTYALDLGTYTNALYDYIHFQWNDSTVFKSVKENLLADHFDLYLMVFSPLGLIFKNYTLLIVQIFFILLGGLGIYKYFSLSGKHRLALFAALYFYLFFGIFSAVSFDYHSNVVAACLVPWFFFFLKQRKLVSAGILLLIILVAKENMSLWMAFVCLGLVIEYRKDPVLRKYMLASVIVCVLYFIMITSIVMPALSNNKTFGHFQYSCLGNNSWEALKFLIIHPLESIKILFINHTHNPFGNNVKAEFHILILVSGLPFLMKKPQYLLMLVPLYFQKLFHDNYTMWSFDGQYSIEFAPILTIGVFMVINEIKASRIKQFATALAIIGALICTIRIMDQTVYQSDKSRIRIYQRSHYTNKYDVKVVHKQLSRIPENAIVSAQSPFLPHLAFRDNIYQFPIIKDAEFIIYSQKEQPYPLDKKSFADTTFSLESSKVWIILYKDENVTILRRLTTYRKSTLKL